MKPFSVYLAEEVDTVERYLQEFGDAVASTHKRFDQNGHTFFIPLKFDSKLPNKMIASCLQGDEPAGWTGLLKYVKNETPKNEDNTDTNLNQDPRNNPDSKVNTDAVENLNASIKDGINSKLFD